MKMRIGVLVALVVALLAAAVAVADPREVEGSECVVSAVFSRNFCPNWRRIDAATTV